MRPLREVTDDEMVEAAREVLILMNEGIPYDAVAAMSPRQRAAYIKALANLCDEPDGEGAESDEASAGGLH